jgi:hypothetical protein
MPDSKKPGKSMLKPRSGWERKAIDMFKSLRAAGDDMRRAARYGAYRRVLSVIVPSLLNSISELTTRMYPNNTAYERWMLAAAAGNLSELVAGGDDKVESSSTISQNAQRLLDDVMSQSQILADVEIGMMEAGDMRPQRGWTRSVKDFVTSLRPLGVAIRRNAAGGDYVELVSRSLPSLLDHIESVLDSVLPDQTSGQRRELMRISGELADIFSSHDKARLAASMEKTEI